MQSVVEVLVLKWFWYVVRDPLPSRGISTTLIAVEK